MPKKKIGKLKEEKEPKSKQPDYKIYGVRKQEEFIKLDRQLPRFLETMMEKNGGVLALFAPPGSGKSNFISNLLLRDDFFKDLFVGGLYIVSPTIEQDLSSVHLKRFADFTSTEYSEQLVKDIMDNINEERIQEEL